MPLCLWLRVCVECVVVCRSGSEHEVQRPVQEEVVLRLHAILLGHQCQQHCLYRQRLRGLIQIRGALLRCSRKGIGVYCCVLVCTRCAGVYCVYCCVYFHNRFRRVACVQRIIKKLAQLCRVVLVGEFLTSQRCHHCKLTRHRKSKDFLTIDRKTRIATCKSCGLALDRDVNAALNLAAVVFEWIATGKRPEYLDASWAHKFQRQSDPRGWSSLSGAYCGGIAAAPAAAAVAADGEEDN